MKMSLIIFLRIESLQPHFVFQNSVICLLGTRPLASKIILFKAPWTSMSPTVNVNDISSDRVTAAILCVQKFRNGCDVSTIIIFFCTRHVTRHIALNEHLPGFSYTEALCVASAFRLLRLCTGRNAIRQKKRRHASCRYQGGIRNEAHQIARHSRYGMAAHRRRTEEQVCVVVLVLVSALCTPSFS